MIIVSFCNSKEYGSIAVLNDELTEFRYLGLGGSITGLTSREGKLFAVRNGIEILQFDKNLNLDYIYRSHMQDIHSITFDEYGNLIVANTAEDSLEGVYVINGFMQGEPFKISKEGLGGDSIHLNSLCVKGNSILFSAFGDHGENRSKSKNGFVKMVSGPKVIKDLRQPHSLINKDGDIYFLESAKGSVYKNFKEIAQVDGYARGLAVLGDKLLVGISRSRNVENSEGCAKALLIDQFGGVYDVIEFCDKGEIYDIIHV